MTACRQAQPTLTMLTPPPATVIGRLSATPAASLTPTLSPTPTRTPTPTLTPTPTPTPTATAPSLRVVGDPRAAVLSPPLSQSGARCGLVDVLDFPMNPPHAINVTGGQDFGVYRNRYGKNHAGEDWWWPARGATFGQPVHSIGHGQVTYAAPLGWGRDQGVVIIRHTFSNGRTLLSFYGHLDPLNFYAWTGDCVSRGDIIALVGDPLSTPHLHFEIRTQSPTEPLGGYWTGDPTLAGWLPPSQTIWEQRIGASPGVQWTRPAAASGSQSIGVTAGELLWLIENDQLIARRLSDGSLRWQYESPGAVSSAALDAGRSIIYLSNRLGMVEAVSLLDAQGESSGAPAFTTLWQIELGVVLGSPALRPLPDGGLVVSLRQQLFGIGADGVLNWSHRTVGQAVSWAEAGGQLFLSTQNGEANLWQMDADGLKAWTAPTHGQLLATGDRVWLYGREGLYRLDSASDTAVLHHPFSPAIRSLGDAIALPGGGLLIAHADVYDRRFVAFDGDGSLRWQRSYAGRLPGNVRFQLVNDQLYVVAPDDGLISGSLAVFALDMENARLTRLFAGGSRSPRPHDNWALTAGESLVINIGGGHLFALDPGQALALIIQAAALR